MKIWVCEVGENLPIGPSPGRQMRAGLLCTELAKRGHEVTWWTSSFDHFRKTKTQPGQQTFHGDGFVYKLELLRSPGYSNHVSPRRFLDHLVNAYDFHRKAQLAEVPDIVFTGMPTPDLAYAAVSYTTKMGIPGVIDVRDLWPDVFERVLPRRLRLPAKLPLKIMNKVVQRSCARSASIIGLNSHFLAWGLDKAQRSKRESDCVIPLAYQDPGQPSNACIEPSMFWSSHGINETSRIVVFAGSFSQQFNFEPIVAAARQMAKSHPEIRFVLCGAGPALPQLTDGNIILPGWVDGENLSWILRAASVGLAPYVSSPDFEENIPNKIVEYLAFGLPILTSLVIGQTAKILRSNSCGLSYKGDSLDGFQVGLISLLDRCDQNMKNRARTVFETSFDAKKVIGELADHLEGVVRRAQVV
jgi:glycosyltransferase involved in cell wall biosynthesis